jgi:autotransporter-associated beta strand protein
LSQTQNPIVGGDNSITNIVAASLIGASGTTLNLVPSQSGTATCVLQLSGTNSGFNGTINIDAVSGIRPVLLSSAAAGSANATWTINASNILQVGGVAVQLGTLEGAGIISNSTPATTATINVGGGSFSGNIANAGTAVMALNKITTSTLTLAGTNTYTGATAVSNGTLLVNGSITSPVTIYTGATLGGSGTLHSNLLCNAGGTLAPGGSTTTGVLTVSSAITNNGATVMKLDRDIVPTSDELVSAKTMTVSGTLTVNNLGSTPQLDDIFTLFSATSYIGSFSSITLPTLPAGLAWNTSSLLSNGKISVVAMPAITGLTPLNPTVECSGSQTFTVAATGQPPLSYQWSVDGTPVIGQTATNFSLLNIHFPSPIIVTVTVTNAYGNVASNSVVAVQDTTPPVITMNGANPMTVECHGSFSDPGATANDACAGSVTVQVSGSVDPNTSGSYQLTYTANDGNGNISTAIRTVNVTDSTAPLIIYSFTNTVLSADTNCSALMPDVTGTNYIIAVDACSGTNLTITQVPTNLTVLPEGTNTVIISVADQTGNTTYSTNTIVVQDETPPVITLNGLSNMTVECHGTYVEPGASATDNCSLAGISTNGTVDPTTPGIYTISYVAVDAAGNSATNTRTVTVQDTMAPVVTLNGPSLMTNYVGTVFVDPGATANDACAGPLPVIVIGTVNTAVAGVYQLQYMAVDPSDNASTNTRTVYILAPVPPVLSGGAMLSGGNFQFSLNGPQGQPYRVLTTTNLADPSSWTVMSSGAFGATGSVFTDTNLVSPGRYYRLVSP